MIQPGKDEIESLANEDLNRVDASELDAESLIYLLQRAQQVSATPALRRFSQRIIEVPLTDSLTRYRVMVVAVDGIDRFGSGESNITARLPLMVRPSAPRFLNFGDRFELPIVLQNQTDENLQVDVGIQTANLTLTDGAGRPAGLHPGHH